MKLHPLDWNFSSCPHDELSILYCYEFSRESVSLREAIHYMRHGRPEGPTYWSNIPDFGWSEWPLLPLLFIPAAERRRRIAQLLAPNPVADIVHALAEQPPCSSLWEQQLAIASQPMQNSTGARRTPVEKPALPPTIGKLGLSKHYAADAQALAQVPEEEFKAKLDEAQATEGGIKKQKLVAEAHKMAKARGEKINDKTAADRARVRERDQKKPVRAQSAEAQSAPPRNRSASTARYRDQLRTLSVHRLRQHYSAPDVLELLREHYRKSAYNDPSNLDRAKRRCASYIVAFSLRAQEQIRQGRWFPPFGPYLIKP